MRNPSREIDKTHLSLDLAEERGLVHRDYGAHIFRWSHVVKFLNKNHRYKDAIVLDVGCGRELPLAKLLYVNKMTPLKYVGVDMNDFDLPEMLKGKKIPVSIWSETDATSLEAADVGVKLLSKEDLEGPGCDDYALPNILVCYEVFEHLTPSRGRKLLEHVKTITSEDCHYFFSTPCYNGSAANNHISETRFEALGALFEDLGYNIEGVYGTFASISDYESQLDCVRTWDKNHKLFAETDLRPIFLALRNYYDTNVLSLIFAPLFPESSRNCLWHLTKKKGDAADQERLFSALEQVPGRWTQHERWRDLSPNTAENSTV